MDPVARQYNDYPYPLPYQDLDEQLAKDVRILGDPARYAPFIWPEGRPRRDLDILSAGCGTHQAAYLAHTNPDCRVTGIDLSATTGAATGDLVTVVPGFCIIRRIRTHRCARSPPCCGRTAPCA